MLWLKKLSIILIALSLNTVIIFSQAIVSEPVSNAAEQQSELSTGEILTPEHTKINNYVNAGYPESLEGNDPSDPRFGMSYDPQLKPFYHGVASGDPLSDRVIIWTRVTVEEEMAVNVNWMVATDVEMQNVVRSGIFATDASRDYTVKVDVDGLQPGTVYYYMFNAMGRNSIVGRMKTLPIGEAEIAKFAIVTCANWQQGWFNAYRRISERNDLDFWVHMGDYFYEYAAGDYAHPYFENREHWMDTELYTLEHYRSRFHQYRLDEDLRRVHQQLPIIAFWDDHEVANDSWMGGAQNHDPETEGEWIARRTNALKAYYEWMPIRMWDPMSTKTWQEFRFGNLFELYRTETRLTGRMQQLLPKGQSGEIDTAAWLDPERTMMGQEQFNWVVNKMISNPTKWTILGSSVMMTPVIGFPNFDAWDGYPAERQKLFTALQMAGKKNFVGFSGDFHMSFADYLVLNPYDPNFNPMTGAGAVGVEFTTPSISAANLNEQEEFVIPPAGPIIYPLRDRLPERHPITLAIEDFFAGINPHLKFVNTDQHGYMLMTVTKERVQTDFFYNYSDHPFFQYFPTLIKTDMEKFAEGWFVRDGETKLNKSDEPYPPKTEMMAPAPYLPPVALNIADVDVCESGTTNLGVFDHMNEPISVTGGSGNFDITWYPAMRLDDNKSQAPNLTNPMFTQYYTMNVMDNETGMGYSKSIKAEILDGPDVNLPILMMINRNQSINLIDIARNHTSGGSGNYAYNWTASDHVISDPQNETPLITLTKYFLTVEDNVMGCPSKEDMMIVFMSPRKDDAQNIAVSENGNAVLYAYPNPAKDNVNIVLEMTESVEASIYIIDETRREVKRFSANGKSVLETTDISALSSGVYLIVIETENDKAVVKFIKN